MSDNDNICPVELRKIIYEFSGNIFLIFGIVDIDSNPDNKKGSDGTGKKVNGMYPYKMQIFASSYPINKGISVITTQIIKPCIAGTNVIGITSNIEACKQGIWFGNTKGCKY